MVVVSKSTLESMTQAPNLLTHFQNFSHSLYYVTRLGSGPCCVDSLTGNRNTEKHGLGNEIPGKKAISMNKRVVLKWLSYSFLCNVADALDIILSALTLNSKPRASLLVRNHTCSHP